jgi:hypothetical protein
MRTDGRVDRDNGDVRNGGDDRIGGYGIGG